MNYRKSSYSGGSEGGSNCVEVAARHGIVWLHDSKHPAQAPVQVPARVLRALTDRIKADTGW